MPLVQTWSDRPRGHEARSDLKLVHAERALQTPGFGTRMWAKCIHVALDQRQVDSDLGNMSHTHSGIAHINPQQRVESDIDFWSCNWWEPYGTIIYTVTCIDLEHPFDPRRNSVVASPDLLLKWGRFSPICTLSGWWLVTWHGRKRQTNCDKEWWGMRNTHRLGDIWVCIESDTALQPHKDPLKKIKQHTNWHETGKFGGLSLCRSNSYQSLQTKPSIYTICTS